MSHCEALTLSEARERFARGGDWRPRQVAKMLRWSLSLVYWHISMGNIKAERYSPRNLRVRGEEMVRFLDEIGDPQACRAAG